MIFKWNDKSEDYSRARGFVCGDLLFVRRENDSEDNTDWSVFSAAAGWQNLYSVNIRNRFAHADKVFYEGDQVTIEF